MNLSAFLVLQVIFIDFLAIPVHGTWSIIATDRATGQVGGAGATCRDGSGSSLVDDDFGSAANKGALVGQDQAPHGDVEDAEEYMQDNALPANGFPDEIINNQGYNGDDEQWAVVDLDGNVLVSTGSSVTDAAETTGHVRPDYTYSVQGNRLSDTDVVTNAAAEFRKKGKGKGKGGKGKGGKGGKGKGGKGGCDDLADRLMRAMEAVVKDGEGDSKCTSAADGYPANTAYLLVKNPDDDEDAPYIELDITTGDYDAVAELREAYDDWREKYGCKKRPKPHERVYPALALVGGIMALLGIGLAGKKRRVFTNGMFIFSSTNDPVLETELGTPYALERGVRA